MGGQQREVGRTVEAGRAHAHLQQPARRPEPQPPHRLVSTATASSSFSAALYMQPRMKARRSAGGRLRARGQGPRWQGEQACRGRAAGSAAGSAEVGRGPLPRPTRTLAAAQTGAAAAAPRWAAPTGPCACTAPQSHAARASTAPRAAAGTPPPSAAAAGQGGGRGGLEALPPPGTRAAPGPKLPGMPQQSPPTRPRALLPTPSLPPTLPTCIMSWMVPPDASYGYLPVAHSSSVSPSAHTSAGKE